VTIMTRWEGVVGINEKKWTEWRENIKRIMNAGCRKCWGGFHKSEWNDGKEESKSMGKFAL